MKNSKSRLLFVFYTAILIALPLSLNSQEIYNVETARIKASKKSIENLSPTLLIELGQGFFDYSDKNWTEKQRDSYLVEIRKKSKISFRENGFDKSSILFAENRELKGQLYKSIFINGQMYGIFGSNESTGLWKICDLFFNNPKGTSISNRRYHISENYFEDYTDADKSKDVKYPIPDSFFFFNYLFDNLSDKGSLFVVFYNKEQTNYKTILTECKSIFEGYQTKKNNIGLIFIDQDAFPNSFKQFATNKHLVNPNRYKKDFYVQLWYDNQVLFDFYGLNSNKLIELKNIIAILSKIKVSAITEYAEDTREWAKYEDFYKAKDKESLLKYLDEKSDSELYQLWNRLYANSSRISNDMGKNISDLVLYLDKNNELAKRTLGIELHKGEITMGIISVFE